jgi:hypothetical protein
MPTIKSGTNKVHRASIPCNFPVSSFALRRLLGNRTNIIRGVGQSFKIVSNSSSRWPPRSREKRKKRRGEDELKEEKESYSKLKEDLRVLLLRLKFSILTVKKREAKAGF